MKNKLVLSVLFALLSSSIFAQDSEELIFGTQIWFAKQGLNQKMMKGMEEKTKKFNRGEDATYNFLGEDYDKIRTNCFWSNVRCNGLAVFSGGYRTLDTIHSRLDIFNGRLDNIRNRVR